MDTVVVMKTWVDFAFHAFDAVKDHVIPVLVAALAGWIVPSPQSVIRKMREPK